MRLSSRTKRRGNALLEFAIVSIFLVPLLLGMFVIGVNLGRSIQVIQLTRDVGHMYAQQVDFSLAANQNILVRLAYGMGMTTTTGDGVVILSKVMYAGAAQCTAAGLTTSQCKNINQNVFLQRIVVGNFSQSSSQFGTPTASLIDSQGIVKNYLTDASAVANNFGSLMTLNPGDVGYMVESFFTSPDLGALANGQTTNSGVYARAIF